MNKQELIEKIEARHVCDLAVSDSFKNGFNTMKGIAVDLAKELDEPAKPEKVEVPQFVADWYEVNKGDLEFNIWKYIFEWNNDDYDEFHEWIGIGDNKPLETLIRMKDGYTVKQEPKWIVKTSDGYWVNSITSNLHNSKVIDFSDNKRPSLIFLDKKTAEAVATLIDGSVEEV